MFTRELGLDPYTAGGKRGDAKHLWEQNALWDSWIELGKKF